MNQKNGTIAMELRQFVKFGLFFVSAGLIETVLFYLLGLIHLSDTGHGISRRL